MRMRSFRHHRLFLRHHRRRSQPVCRSPKKNLFVFIHRRFITHRVRCRGIDKGRHIVLRGVVVELRGSRLCRQYRLPRRLRERTVRRVIVAAGQEVPLRRSANERMRHGNRTVVGPKNREEAPVGIRGTGVCD